VVDEGRVVDESRVSLDDVGRLHEFVEQVSRWMTSDSG
jgi:hypothetical protein